MYNSILTHKLTSNNKNVDDHKKNNGENTMKTWKIIIGISILFLLIGSVSAAINSGLAAPDEFEKSDIWDTAIYDIYSLKDDNNTQLQICNYTEDDYDLLFKTDTDSGYYVNELGNNIFMGKDNDFSDGYVLEVIDYNGEKYIVHTYLMDNPTNDEIKDSLKYLEEFNKINNVEPIEV